MGKGKQVRGYGETFYFLLPPPKFHPFIYSKAVIQAHMKYKALVYEDTIVNKMLPLI